jgi:DNA-binding SARP family transcriptional activator
MTSTVMAQHDHLAPVMVSLLGAFDLAAKEARASIGGGKVESLVTHLALARRRPVQRADLIDRLWPGHDPALAGLSLNNLVYQLNKSAKPLIARMPLIVHDSGSYYLNTGQDIGVDVTYFEIWSARGQQLVSGGALDQGIAVCERALALYRGHLVGDSDIQTVIERESLRATFLDLLATLADCHIGSDPARALTYIQRLLTHDPCREDAHRLAMRCYMGQHARTKALRQFQLCGQALRIEFDAEPEQETIALYNQIRLDPASV